MAVAEYFARQAFMVGSDGAVQVSKPAMAPFSPPCDGDGLFASTGPVGDGLGELGEGASRGAVVSGPPGGTPQAVASPVGGGGLSGQAGFGALTTAVSLAGPFGLPEGAG
jgi:hypothetical protein